MKYRDLITLFVGLGFILSLPYGLVVNTQFWFLPVMLLVALFVVVYALWM